MTRRLWRVAVDPLVVTGGSGKETMSDKTKIPEVGGRHIDCSLDTFERRARICLGFAQDEINPSSTLISVLSDAVRLAREYGDVMPSKKKLWLVWSHEHTAWWKPNRNGYCMRKQDAGRYTLEEALEICRAANQACNMWPMEAMVQDE